MKKDYFKQLRKTKTKLSFREGANLLDLSIKDLSDIEHGRVKVGIAGMAKIAQKYRISFNDMKRETGIGMEG